MKKVIVLLKKRLPALMICLTLLTVVAAGCAAPAEAQYAAGTYTAEAQGHNGLVKVSVTLSGDAILSVTVDEHDETVGIGEIAVSRIPDAIVSGQTLAVDAVAGATITSAAILQAVTACITEGGGDIAALQVAQEGSGGSTEVRTLSADIVVVGAGGAGLATAVSAHQNGASVIIVEKAVMPGGNTLISGSAYNTSNP